MADGNIIRIRKWDEYQARNDKRLFWVKLHTRLTTAELMLESPAVFRAAIVLLLLAAEGDVAGECRGDAGFLRWRLAIGSDDELEHILERLEVLEFIEVLDVGTKSDSGPTEGRLKADPRGRARASSSISNSSSNSDSENKGKRGARKAPTEAELASAKNVLHVLNAKSGRRFRMHNPAGGVTANAELIIDRLRDGWLEDYLRAVVVHRWRAWGDKPEMRDNLQPSTLFRKSNFERYVADVPELEPPAPAAGAEVLDFAAGGAE